MGQPAIRCEQISKTYGEGENLVHALKNVTLEILMGELTILAGPSGSGKTTLISIIATILTPDQGKLFLLDQDMGLLSDDEKARFRNKHMGIVFQSLFLIPTLTVLENVTLPLIIAGDVEESAKEKAMVLLKRVHLDHRAHVSPALLSKGQQQRIAIARAMINESQIIICDEPTSSLDHVTGFEIMEFLKELAADNSKAVLVVTHDPRIFSYANRIININDGQVTV